MRITLRNENIPTLPKAIPSFSPCSLVPLCVAGYCNVDLQSSYLKAKSLEQRGYRPKHGFKLKLFFSIFSKLNQIRINKAGVKLQAYMTLQIFCNP